MSDALFGDEDPVAARLADPKLSAQQRRTTRQTRLLQLDQHPLGLALRWPLGLHAEAAPADDRDAPGRRCGNCAFRQLITWHNSTYPKCLYGLPEGGGWGAAPRATHGGGTDVRAWWPGCRDHEYEDGAR